LIYKHFTPEHIDKFVWFGWISQTML